VEGAKDFDHLMKGASRKEDATTWGAQHTRHSVCV